MAVNGAVGLVLKGYPRLSETFIAQEIRALEVVGLDLRIISLRHPSDAETHPVHREIRAPVNYLPEYLHDEPRRVWRAWRAWRSRPSYRRTRAIWLRDLRRDPTRNRLRRFGQALVLAHELPSEVVHLHAHFLHTPASVASYAASLLGLGWSCSAHAKDIWTSPEWEKCEKLASCRWAVTCTEFNRAHLAALAPMPERIELVYHGLDLVRFAAPSGPRPARDGSDPEDPVVLLSVGRAVAKKGYEDLLVALARLPARLSWRFVHVGGGARRGPLQRQARSLGIADRIIWLGALAQEAVREQYRAADCFVLACRVADDGDRDGLPNVLMEAQSQGLVCLSTRVSAVPELIEDGVTGMLVGERDPVALAGVLEHLITDPVLRARLGTAGEQRIQREFGMQRGIARVYARLVAEVAGKVG